MHTYIKKQTHVKQEIKNTNTTPHKRMVIMGTINAKVLSQTQVALRNGQNLKNLKGQQYILFTNATETWGVDHVLVG